MTFRMDGAPSPLPYSTDQVRDAVLAVTPDADFSDPTWGHIERPGVDIEVNLHGDITDSFVFHVRASDEVAAEAVIAAVLSSLGLRAFDPVGSESGIFTPRQ